MGSESGPSASAAFDRRSTPTQTHQPKIPQPTFRREEVHYKLSESTEWILLPRNNLKERERRLTATRAGAEASNAEGHCSPAVHPFDDDCYSPSDQSTLLPLLHRKKILLRSEDRSRAQL